MELDLTRTGVAETITLPGRFNGPAGSANGGYTCGVVAGFLDGGAEVSLRSPPPLERELAVERVQDGLRLLDDGTLVADARMAWLELEVPGPVPPAAAAQASNDGYERWTAHHPFRTCVVCGPDREPGDGLRIFPGPYGDLHAADWRPDASLADGNGHVRPECLWAALDCPTSAPVANFGEGPPVVLASLLVRIDGLVPVLRDYAILSWPIAVDGRKRRAGAVLYDERGQAMARARALWIELRE